MSEHTDVLVVGGGQAGLAMSEHLSAEGISHLIIERGRIAESWRSARWDSLVANGPAWHDRFPGQTYSGVVPDAFPDRHQVADYFDTYAQRINAPVRCGVEVTSVRRLEGKRGFRAETSDGSITAQFIVAATGPFQVPVMPSFVPAAAVSTQIHSSQYRNPSQLPEGAVLVVGAGASGVQIADELERAGRTVYLSVGRHERPIRRYRGRDSAWWLGVLGIWDAEPVLGGTNHVAIAVSGARGGYTVDFRALAARGIRLVGRTSGFDGGRLTFAEGLGENIARGDASYLALLDEADRYVEQNGLDFPEEPEARVIGPDPASVTDPVLEVDLAEHEVTSIIWATGFTSDFSWLDVGAFDDKHAPHHRRGVSSEPGVYFLGLPWLTRRASSFIWGVWHDAKFVADHISTQRAYLQFGAHEPVQQTTVESARRRRETTSCGSQIDKERA